MDIQPLRLRPVGPLQIGDGHFHVSLVTAFRADQQGILARLCQQHVFMGHLAPHHAGIGTDRDDLGQPDPGENAVIRRRDFRILPFQIRLGGMERIRILHGELAHADQSAAGTRFVTELRLDLIDQEGVFHVGGRPHSAPDARRPPHGSFRAACRGRSGPSSASVRRRCCRTGLIPARVPPASRQASGLPARRSRPSPRGGSARSSSQPVSRPGAANRCRWPLAGHTRRAAGTGGSPGSLRRDSPSTVHPEVCSST